MKDNLEKTTVKDISHLIHSDCLRAPADTPLEKLADQLCASERYFKVYLEDGAGRLAGVIQAKQIAMKVLELSRRESDEEEMLPAIAFVLNSLRGADLAETPVVVNASTKLKDVLALMDQNHIREIAVVDAEGKLAGTLEAKNILFHYVQAKAKANF